jgi:hypothetical protein
MNCPAATLDEVAARYPDVPRLIVIKTDVQRRGVFYIPSQSSVVRLAICTVL